MKNWTFIKCVLYVVFSVLILIFHIELVQNLKYLIGFLMILYGLEQVIVHLVIKKKFDEANRFFWGVMEVVLGLVILFLVSDYASICLVWAIWSILRESHEIEELIIKILSKQTSMSLFIFSFIESIISIGFSISLIVHPNQEHALIHVILLNVELFTTAIYTFFENVYQNKKCEKSLSK